MFAVLRIKKPLVIPKFQVYDIACTSQSFLFRQMHPRVSKEKSVNGIPSIVP